MRFLVPFYGDPELLYRTVGSVLAQDNPRWTLTVVDDGYPDPAVGAFFAGLSDPRVTYLRNERNLGANGNYRRCVQLAGDPPAAPADADDLVVILGADDELLPMYVDTVLAAHRLFPGAAVVQPGVRVIDETGADSDTLLDTVKQRVLRPRATAPRELGGAALAGSLLRGNWLYFPSLAFRREPLRRIGFQDGLDVVQDLALVIDLVAAGETLVLVPDVCFRYRRHRASDSSERALSGTRFAEERRYFLQAADQVDRLGWRRAARSARRHLLSRVNALLTAPRAMRHRDPAAARTLVRYALGRAR